MRNYNINLHITHDAFLKLGRVFSWFPKQAHTHIAKPEVQISSVRSILSALFPPYIIILWKIHLHITQITLASQRRSPKTSFSDFKGITNKINCEAERGDQSLDFDYVCAACCEDDDDGISTYANVHRSDWKKKSWNDSRELGQERGEKIKFIAVRLFHSIGKEWNVSESKNAQWEKGRQARRSKIVLTMTMMYGKRISDNR